MTHLSQHFALIVDDRHLRQWQAEALSRIAETADFTILNCTNTRPKRKALRHGLYYLLNLLSLKSPLTRSVPLPDFLRIRKIVTFRSEQDGIWQRLPASVIDQISGDPPQLVIKFGMGLLRVQPALACPILSYHHGDPRRFRGRPAGFYELLSGCPVVGQIVQILSDRLDAGKVLAYGETRAYVHSYRATMLAAYRTSPLLLPRAIRNCLAGQTLPIEPTGKNYRLPSNGTVLRFGARRLLEKMRLVFHKSLFESHWEVAEAKAGPELAIDSSRFPPRPDWRIAPRPQEYKFLADPFPHPGGGLVVEALRKADQLGEIVHLNCGSRRVICTGKGHFSYPSVFELGGEWFLLPETASWSAPTVFRLSDKDAVPFRELDVEGSPRIKDPTLVRTNEGLFLFGNIASEGESVLRLWKGSGLANRFSEHVASPIRTSPTGSRMGGAVLEVDGRLLRVGQDCARAYGEGVVIFEIEQLTKTEFAEVEIGRLSFDDVKGPHTLNFHEGRVIFDFYVDRFAPLAGWRRFRARWSRFKAAGDLRPRDCPARG